MPFNPQMPNQQQGMQRPQSPMQPAAAATPIQRPQQHSGGFAQPSAGTPGGVSGNGFAARFGGNGPGFMQRPPPVATGFRAPPPSAGGMAAAVMPRTPQMPTKFAALSERFLPQQPAPAPASVFAPPQAPAPASVVAPPQAPAAQPVVPQQEGWNGGDAMPGDPTVSQLNPQAMQLLGQLNKNLPNMDANAKAAWYNSMLGTGANDAAIRQAASSIAGQQTDADWAYLTQLAQQSQGMAAGGLASLAGAMHTRR